MPYYRCNANLVWDIEADSQQIAQEEAIELMSRMMEAGALKKRPKVSVHKMRDHPVTQRLAEFPAQDILSQVGEKRQTYDCGGKQYLVRMNSHRYHTFLKNNKCVVCGTEGTRMILELPPKARQPHFNLYAVEGDIYVLMTKDHILPVAHGGLDDLQNYQTMCSICNGFRGANEFTTEEILHLRTIYNVNRGKVSSEEMRKIMKTEKALIGKELPCSISLAS